MTLNYDCVRDLLMYFDDFLFRTSPGRVHPIKMNNLRSDELFKAYTQTELADAVHYLLQKKWISVANSHISNPLHYKITGITASGHDRIALLRDCNLWNKIKKSKILELVFALAPETLAAMLQNMLK